MGEDKVHCDAFSPVHYVSRDNPPFLIPHGDRDTPAPFPQGEEPYERLEKVGVEVTLQRIPGAMVGQVRRT